MISNIGWVCIILIMAIICGISRTIDDVMDYKKKQKTDFDYLEYKDKH